MSAAVNVNVSTNILKWVRQQVSASDSQEISIIDKWLNGTELPTLTAIRNISRKIHIPFGYFFLETPPAESPLMNCRTVNSSKIQQSSRELIDTFNSMARMKDWMAEYAENSGFEPLSFVGSVNKNDNPLTVAKNIRNRLNLAENWFTSQKNANKAYEFLRETISAVGILVFQNGVVGLNNHRALEVKEFRAFTLIDRYAPLIFINSNDSATAKIFSLVHELAHVWLGEENLFNDNFFVSQNNVTEQFCNAVAAEILAPKKIFLAEWKNTDVEPKEKILQLVAVFHCSSLVVARRALDLKLIAKKLYENFVQVSNTVESPKLKRGRGGNFYKTLAGKMDKRFINALDSSTKSGNTPFLDAYRLTGLSENVFNELVKVLNQRQASNS